MLNGMVVIDPAQEAAAKKNAADDAKNASTISRLEQSIIPADLPKEPGIYALRVTDKGKDLVYSWDALKE